MYQKRNWQNVDQTGYDQNQKYTRGILAKYAKLASSASLGAVTDLNLNLDQE